MQAVLDAIVHPGPALRRFVNGYNGLLQAARASLFWAVFARQKRWVRWMFVTLFSNFALTILISNITRGMVDQGIVAQVIPLREYVRATLQIAILVLIVNFSSRMITSRLSYHIEFDLRTWLYTRIHAAELRRLDGVASGQLVTRAITDLNIVETILGVLPIIIGLLPIMLGMSIFVMILSPSMGLVSLIPLPLNLWLLSMFRKRLFALSWAELNERAEVTSAVSEPVRGIRVVKAFGQEDAERNKVGNVALKAYRYAMTRARLLARYDILLKGVPVATSALMLLIGARLVARGNLSLGTFLLSFQLASFITQITQIFDEIASAWQYLKSAQDRLGEMLEMGEKPTTIGQDLPEEREGIVMRGVDIELGGRRVVSGLDLSIAPGELVVLQGAPGSGKTSVAAAAIGLVSPANGSITLDGVPLFDVDPDALRSAVRVVSEEPFLFAVSVRENLELAAEQGSPDETLERALWAAAATDVVAELPDGLDTAIGDRGLTLSGGQRQRLALARALVSPPRALVSPPRVLVLDDALSACNPGLEVDILTRVRQHAPQTAILCISRRQGARAVADRVHTLADPSAETTAAAQATGAPTLGAGMGPVTALAELPDLKLTTESPGVTDAVVKLDQRPKVGGMARPFAVLLAGVIVVLLLQTLSGQASSVLLGEVAEVVEDENTRRTDLIALLALGIGVGGAGLAYALRVLIARFTQGCAYLLRRRIFHRLSVLGIDYYDRELPGQVAARVVYDLDIIQGFLQGPVFRLLTAVAQLGVGLTLVAVLGPQLVPLVIVMAVVMIGLSAIQLPIATRASNAVRDQIGRVTAKFEEDFEARHEIRHYGAVGVQTTKFVAEAWELRRARWWQAIVNNLYGEAMYVLSILAGTFVLWRAGNLVLAGAITVGSSLTLRLVVQQATQPLTQIGSLYTQFINVRVSWARLRQPYDVPILPVIKPGAIECSTLRGEIYFDNISFTYPGTGRQVLHEVSFRIRPGQVAALVGYTGAGKSSIAKLLVRMYDPQSGEVKVDGKCVADFELGTYRRRVGVVPQDAFVFKGTVADNIAYGLPGTSREEIERAARRVGVHEVLAAMPGGYDHKVDEEGRNLTAAQRQLIALARAWLAQPDVLVLDECTSTLDAPLERKVLEAIGKLGRTTLMVTHRQSVVEKADTIIVLDAGRVADMGRAAEVMRTSAAYAGLWSAETEVPSAEPPRRRRAAAHTKTANGRVGTASRSARSARARRSRSRK